MRPKTKKGAAGEKGAASSRSERAGRAKGGQDPAGNPGKDPLTAVRPAVRDLILVLADSKRLLGFRYAEWMIGAPELEAGIACSSMAQDEWGHARLLYALLKDFDDDVDALEHGRDAADYRNMAVLDGPAASWPDLVALMALADTALTVQLEALRGSSYDPLRQRVEKLLEEERFHAAHGAAWFKRLAGGTEASKAALKAAVERVQGSLLAWFGPDDGAAGALRDQGVQDAAGSDLRARFTERVKPLLTLVLYVPKDYKLPKADFGGFDESRRRMEEGGPDEETIRRIRGDLNRAFLIE